MSTLNVNQTAFHCAGFMPLQKIAIFGIMILSAKVRIDLLWRSKLRSLFFFCNIIPLLPHFLICSSDCYCNILAFARL